MTRTRLLRQALLTLVIFLIAGVIAGLIWSWWWSPAPSTNAYLLDGGRPFFEPDQEFRATGLYLAVAVPIGVALGAVFMWVHDRDELLTLILVVVSAVLAGLLMAAVGSLLGPDTPRPIDVEGTYPDGFPTVEAALSASRVAWFLGFPGGALVGSVLVLVGFPGAGAPPRRDLAAVDVPPAGEPVRSPS